MENNFETFPFKFENCAEVVNKYFSDRRESSPNQCWVCPQFDCCKWKKRVEKELRERFKTQKEHWSELGTPSIRITEILGEN